MYESEELDKHTMSLSIISLLCCLPAVNTDLHLGNLCIYRPDITFIFVWTIKTGGELTEFIWDNKGIITCIDWDKYLPLTSKPLISIRGMDKYILTPLEGDYEFSFEGIKTLIDALKLFVDPDKFIICSSRCLDSPYL